jgi:hypothetical protein
MRKPLAGVPRGLSNESASFTGTMVRLVGVSRQGKVQHQKQSPSR